MQFDVGWARTNADRICPGGVERRLRDAAWEAYLASAPYENVFEVLRHQYQAAVEELPTVRDEDDRRHFLNPSARLAEHLMILYLRGRLTFDALWTGVRLRVDSLGLLERSDGCVRSRLRNDRMGVARAVGCVTSAQTAAAIDFISGAPSRGSWISRLWSRSNSGSSRLISESRGTCPRWRFPSTSMNVLR